MMSGPNSAPPLPAGGVAPAKWIVGIAVIVFDIDVGQRVDLVAPGAHAFTEEELSAVAFHSFPVREQTNLPPAACASTLEP